MKRTYKLAKNLLLEIDYSKYESEIMDAIANWVNKVYFSKDKEDEERKGAFWDLANEIVSAEIGWLENLMYEGKIDFSIEIGYLLDEIYDDLHKAAIDILKNKWNVK